MLPRILAFFNLFRNACLSLAYSSFVGSSFTGGGFGLGDADRLGDAAGLGYSSFLTCLGLFEGEVCLGEGLLREGACLFCCAGGLLALIAEIS
jgi:hypothetical protein